MKTYLGYAIAALFGALLTFTFTEKRREPSWQLVYAHDNSGIATEGQKADLVAAVIAGKEVRVYWEGRYVKHAADAGFLTVIGDEVFAQIHEIKGQRPTETPPSIEFRQDTTWSTIFATNGDRALRWFVKG
ncbi:MAG: hypothetical protein AB3N28_11025 [Kordiimonas sp.]